MYIFLLSITILETQNFIFFVLNHDRRHENIFDKINIEIDM